MIALESRWQLLDGCPPELDEALKAVAPTVMDAEPNTLVYSVHLEAKFPLNSDFKPADPPPPPIPLSSQKEVIFFEVYADAQAFADHINGPVFTKFRTENIQYFQEDPNSPGWPVTKNTFFERESAFFRPEAN